MKIFSRLSLEAAALILFFNALAVTEARAQGVLNEILKRMDAHQKSLSSLRSKLRMEKYNAQLKEIDVSDGTAIYLRTSQNQTLARIDWTKPVAESLYFTNDKYVHYRPRLNQAILGKFDRAKNNIRTHNALLFLKMSKQEIKANYNIRYYGTEKVKDTPVWHLELIPKKPDIYKSADLWVEGSGMPIQSKVLQPNNDTTTVRLSDFKKNETVKFSIFQPNLPKGTKIIQADSGSVCPCFKPDNAVDSLKDDADAVFSGRVIAASGADYTVITERTWKGAVGNEEIARSFSTENSCATKLTVGERYVLFAKKKSIEGKSIMALMPCNLSSSLNSASGRKILKEIGNGKPLKKAAVPRKRTPVKSSRKRRA